MSSSPHESPRRNRGGRPPKFGEPSRPVTLTLPERTLRLLATLDGDRARAIVKLADTALGSPRAAPRLVELVAVSPTHALILVAHSRRLREIPWLNLFEVAPGRHLISLAPGTSIERLEVTLSDLLDTLPEGEELERDLIKALHHTLRTPRRTQTSIKEEILLVERPPAAPEPARRRRTG